MNLENQLAPFSPPETNFVERLRYWALAQPEGVALRFINKSEDDGYEELTYLQFDERVRAIAAKLTSLGLTNQRALMMYPPGIDFVAAFFACHYAGVTPVPAYPPRRNRNMGRINAITEDAETTVALTVQSRN